MAIIKVFTNDGKLVSQLMVPDDVPLSSGNIVVRNMLGRSEPPLGWLGRALEDARIMARGGDPERPSEKVMRLLSNRRQPEEDQPA